MMRWNMNGDNRPEQSGHARPEILGSLALVGISISLATPWFNKYGFPGWVIGSILIFIGIVAVLFALAGAFWVADRINLALKGKDWYRISIKTLHVVVFITSFSFFGIIILVPQVFFFDLSVRGQTFMLSIGPVIIGILMTVFRFREEERFWDEFGRLCLALFLAFICELVTTPVGLSTCTDSPGKSVYFSAAGIVIPMGVYFFKLFRRLKQPPESE